MTGRDLAFVEQIGLVMDFLIDRDVEVTDAYF